RGASTRKVFPITRGDKAINELQRPHITTNTLTTRYEAIGTGSYVIEGKQHAQKIIQIGNIDQHKRERENPQTGRVYDTKGIAPSLTTMQGGGLEPKILKGKRIRKLTPKECWRLQGFPDELF